MNGNGDGVASTESVSQELTPGTHMCLHVTKSRPRYGEFGCALSVMAACPLLTVPRAKTLDLLSINHIPTLQPRLDAVDLQYTQLIGLTIHSSQLLVVHLLCDYPTFIAVYLLLACLPAQGRGWGGDGYRVTAFRTLAYVIRQLPLIFFIVPTLKPPYLAGRPSQAPA